MLPTIPSRYPEFVSDQVLTATNLNDMFDYLDEQVRMTRANLIGIGIVCGLEVKISAGGGALTITKGCGVTSSGYLVTLPETTYTFYNDRFTAEQEIFYDRFVDPATKQQRFPLLELAEAGSTGAHHPLSADVLKNKVVLLFVELLLVENKNCDPDSCDDKGQTITVNMRPLLIDEVSATALLGAGIPDGFNGSAPRCIAWPELRMPRYDVPATVLPTTAEVLQRFLAPLETGFLGRVENMLRSAYIALRPLVEDSMPVNPFNGLKNRFAFLGNGSIGVQQLIHAQYYYDLFSDLLQAYDELRRLCNSTLAVCCPNEEAFPRHLLLGRALNQGKDFRHTHMPSPAVCCGPHVVEGLRALLQRLARLVGSVHIPVTADDLKLRRLPVKATPSRLGPEALSAKAIPYYYDVLAGSPPLFELWDPEKTRLQKGRRNLSYRAPLYNTEDDWVTSPLQYDLEPYNFLRIEGHIGMHWREALQELTTLRRGKRLPFQVVALNGDFRTMLAFFRESIADIGKSLADRPEEWRKILCMFGDIELQYDTHAAELRCVVGRALNFLNSLSDVPATNDLVGNFTLSETTASISPLVLRQHLEGLGDVLPGGIVKLQVTALGEWLNTAVAIARQLLQQSYAMTDEVTAIVREYRFHLNTIIRLCKVSVFQELYRTLLQRFKLYLESQTFAMYSYLHSGIQHKAGVPMGGTFIVVYHDKPSSQKPSAGRVVVEAARERRSAAERAAAAVREAAARRAAETDTTIGTDTNTGSGPAINREEEIRRILRETGSTGVTREAIEESVFSSGERLADNSSVKEAGEYMLEELIAVMETEKETGSKSLKEVVAEIPDGTVIADFYLPYACCSDCPPMNFIVLPSDTQEEPTISIEEHEFCASDKDQYVVTVSPDGGELTSDAGGVSQSNDGEWEFTPAAVDIGDAETLTVTLTYTVNDASATTQVTLVHHPSAGFRSAQSADAPLSVSFTNTSKFATSYKWEFGDGNGSDAENPTHTYEKGGDYAVALTALNPVCPPHTRTRRITVKDAAPEPQCMRLDALRDHFLKFDASVSNAFREQFQPYATARNIYLQKIPELLSMAPQKQAEALATMLPPSLIIKWMAPLNDFIMRNPRGRGPHLAMFRILHATLMFYACVQKGDINSDPVPTAEEFNIETNSMFLPWTRQAPPFNRTERQGITALHGDIGAELERINAEQPGKRLYITVLKKQNSVLRGIR